MKDWDLVPIFYGGHPIFPALFVEEAIFSPMHVLASFVKNQMAVAIWVCV
jgi:hypothetical protein